MNLSVLVAAQESPFRKDFKNTHSIITLLMEM